MGRPKVSTNKTDDSEHEMLFPELERNNPEHKDLLKLAKDFGKKKQEHAIGISELKGLRDCAEKKLIAKMHELNLTGFIFDGIRVNIELGDEKALIKMSEDVAAADKNEINPE